MRGDQSIQMQTELTKSKQAWPNNLLDLTTACVCADVPDAMLVKAQAASNCNEGLMKKERNGSSDVFEVVVNNTSPLTTLNTK